MFRKERIIHRHIVYQNKTLFEESIRSTKSLMYFLIRTFIDSVLLVIV